jgi:calcium-dependent protein kinase
MKKGIGVLKNELSILRESDHPNIIKLYETYEDETSVHIVMEYCKGGDLLDNLIETGQYDEELTAKIFGKILSAVNYLHSLNICHRDIKPDNFLFTSKRIDAEIKCIDFGLATKFGEDDMMHSKVGTPYYLAPEVLRGNYRKECDIWSLGALLYVMLGGYPPFEGKNQNSVFKKIMQAQFNFKKRVWKNVSVEAKDLIRRMLVPNPKRRITIPLALNHSWLLRYRRMDLPKVPLKIFESLKNIKAPRKLEQEAMKVIIQDLSLEEIHELKEAFLAIDTEKTGFITAEGISQALKNSRLYLAQEHMQKIINSVNYLGYGKLNYTAFLMATLNKKLIIDEEKLYEAFKHFDINNKGFITAGDLRIVLQKSGSLVDEEHVERMLMEVGLHDKNGLDYEDFKRLILTQGNY